MSGQQSATPGLSDGSESNPNSSKRRRTFEPKQQNLGYVDVALFFLGVFVLSLASRAAAHVGLFPASTLVEPPLPLQAAISLLLVLDLYLAIRLRHGPGVWRLLGWKKLNRQSLLGAIAGGTSLAILVDLVARSTTDGVYPIHFWEIALVDVTLGPFVEESFFRGCLQPVITHTAGRSVGILATAVIFASLHQVSTAIQWVCLLGTGVAYGWMRTKTNSTSPAACMHAAYNLALFLCQFR